MFYTHALQKDCVPLYLMSLLRKISTHAESKHTHLFAVLHTLSLASQCTGYSASHRQQASGCCLLFSLGSHTLHVMGWNQPPDWEDNTWGEASNNNERSVMYYWCYFLCFLLLFLEGRRKKKRKRSCVSSIYL